MLVINPEFLKVWLRQQTVIAIDTETNITEKDHERFLVGVSFYAPGDEPFYLPVGHVEYLYPIQNAEFWDFSEDLRPDVTLIFHNAKFDLKVLRSAGCNLLGFDIVDTMLWHHLLDQYRPHDLAQLEKKYLHKDVKKDLVKKIKVIREGVGMEYVPPEVMAIYASNDVVSTYELFALFQPKLEAAELIQVWEESDQKFMKLLVLLEERGLRLDHQRSRSLAAESKLRIQTIRDVLPFDPQKPKEVRERFFGPPPHGLGLRPSKLTPKTSLPATDEEALTGINHPEAGLLLEYRGLHKAVSTWFEGLPDKADQGGYLHPDFRQHGTLTHRLSCAEPNSQQFPREGPVRSLFLSEEGFDLVEFDYRAIEFRLAAWYCHNESLMDLFRRNGDIHQFVAERLGIGRQPAKNTNFAIIYAGGPGTIARTAGIPLKEAREIYRAYREEYPELFEIAEKCERLARARGWIRYWDGRRRVFKADYEYRKAFNSVVQGGAFQIIKRSMLMLHEQGVDMRNQVHDSIWVNVPHGESYDPIINTMVDWTVEQFGIPFHVESKVLHHGNNRTMAV